MVAVFGRPSFLLCSNGIRCVAHGLEVCRDCGVDYRKVNNSGLCGSGVSRPSSSSPVSVSVPNTPSRSSSDVVQENVQKLIQLRKKGNEAYAAGSLVDSVAAYTQALDEVAIFKKAFNGHGPLKHDVDSHPALRVTAPYDAEAVALHSNLAAVFLELGMFDFALAEARAATALDDTWVKGHFREGRALYELGRWSEAFAAFSLVLKLDPSHADAQKYIFLLLPKNCCKRKADWFEEDVCSVDQGCRPDTGTGLEGNCGTSSSAKSRKRTGVGTAAGPRSQQLQESEEDLLWLNSFNFEGSSDLFSLNDLTNEALTDSGDNSILP